MTGDNDASYRAGMKQVSMGMSRAEVIDLVGKPRSCQHFRSDYVKDDTCYWGSWQIVFENGEVTSKNRY
jgi:hypothetical protein